MSVEFFILNNSCAKAWNDFVLSHPQGSLHQTSAWVDFQKQIPGRDEVLGFGMKDDQGQIVATCLCVKMHTGVGNKYWYYSPRGPVNPGPDFIKYIAHQLTNSSTRPLFWRLDPYITEPLELPDLKTSPATQQYQPTDSLVLDITQSEEDLLAQMKRKGRYNINLARKKEVKIKKSEDIHIFWKIYQETTGRDGFAGHEKSYYEKFLNLPYSELFIAEFEGTPIAAAIATFCGNKAIYYYGASTSDPKYRPLMAPYLLQWEMIREAKTRDCESYDFTGIAPEDQPNHEYAGISAFKWKFGGDRDTYRPAQEIIFRSFWYRVYRWAKKLRR